MKKQFIRIAMILVLLGTFLLMLPTVASAHSVQKTALQGNVCGGVYSGENMFWMGIYVGRINVSVGICYNGRNVWQSGWGPDCSVGTYISHSVTWCGVYNNGGSFAEPGANVHFWVPINVGPFQLNASVNCYIRTHVTSTGGLNTWGGC